MEQFSKARASAVHPALDRADCGPANLGGFFVTQPLGPDQEKNLALLKGKLRESPPEVLEIEAGVLFRRVERELAIAPSGSSTSRLRLRNEV